MYSIHESKLVCAEENLGILDPSVIASRAQESLAQLERETRALYAEKSNAYYATSRLWDDGIIEPNQTRDVLALCLAVAATRPPSEERSPVYRM